jgi:hypothetical protein
MIREVSVLSGVVEVPVEELVVESDCKADAVVSAVGCRCPGLADLADTGDLADLAHDPVDLVDDRRGVVADRHVPDLGGAVMSSSARSGSLGDLVRPPRRR